VDADVLLCEVEVDVQDEEEEDHVEVEDHVDVDEDHVDEEGVQVDEGADQVEVELGGGVHVLDGLGLGDDEGGGALPPPLPSL